MLSNWSHYYFSNHFPQMQLGVDQFFMGNDHCVIDIKININGSHLRTQDFRKGGGGRKFENNEDQKREGLHLELVRFSAQIPNRGDHDSILRTILTYLCITGAPKGGAWHHGSQSSQHLPRWAFNRANWDAFYHLCNLEINLSLISPEVHDFHKNFTSTTFSRAKRTIPKKSHSIRWRFRGGAKLVKLRFIPKNMLLIEWNELATL